MFFGILHRVFVMSSEGSHQLIGAFNHQPEYQELEELLVEARKRDLEIFAVAKETSTASEESIGSMADEELEDVKEFEIDSMDASSLRQQLSKRGLPTSGKIAKLKERLKEVILSEEANS